MKKFCFISLILLLFDCSNDNVSELNPSDLHGQWVETEKRMDTLTFNTFENIETVILGRGKELNNGYMLPKHRSGMYEYKLMKNGISLRWLLSNDINFNNYFFKIKSDKLNIGNFYDSPIGDTLTFERLE